MALVSENITQKLTEAYQNISKDEILKRLSTAPPITTVRVNNTLISTEDAVAELSKHLLQKSSTHSYTVYKHPDISDVLLISPNTTKSCDCNIYEKEVMVDTSCGAAILRGADVYVPGVLAAHPGMQVGDRVSVYADLEKKCRRGYIKTFTGLKLFVGNGIALCDRQSIFDNNTKSGVAIQMNNQLPSFSDLNTSLFFPQNLPSAVVSHVLNPHHEDRILDMCSAPGGKSTHVASLLQNKGTVISIDKTLKKVEKIKQNYTNLQLSNISCYAYDGTKLLATESTNLENSDIPPFKACSFDKILLDPPCSGLGQRPQLRYIMTNKEVESYPHLQRKLIKQAYELLKPGGLLVYSTCTLLPAENEEQVAWILKTYPTLTLERQVPHLGNPGLEGYGLTYEECSKLQRFDKFLVREDTESIDCNVNEADIVVNRSNEDSIGFFIAKFKKT